MPSTYTTNLGIEKIGTGEQSGTWGTTTNTNFDLIDQGVNGIVQVTLAAVGSTGSPNALTVDNGAVSDGRNKFIEFVDGGDLGGTAYVQLQPNDAEKVAFIRNSLSGSRSIIIFQGTYNASNDFEIPNGADVVLKFDGAGASATVTQVFENLTVSSATLASGVTVNAILDEDNMASDSDTALATQQSIKAYVDSQVTAQDLDIAGDTGTGAVDLDSQSLTIAGTANEIETSASGQTITVGLPNAVTIADLTATTADINGGTIDGTVIGGSSAAAGTFTSITGTSANINGTVTADGLTVDGSASVKVNSGTNQLTIDNDDSTGTAASPQFTDIVFQGYLDRQRARIRGVDRAANYVRGGLTIQTQNSSLVLKDRMFVDGDGDISFYEDTGTTPKFFWDASAESLGIGTTSPDRQLVINNASSFAGLKLTEGVASTDVRLTASDSGAGLFGTWSNHPLVLYTNGLERARIASSGNVGIGTTSPASALDVAGTVTADGLTVEGTSVMSRFRTGSATDGRIEFAYNTTDIGYINMPSASVFDITARSGVDLSLGAGGSERMRITSSGNVGIGTSSPQSQLQVRNPSDASSILSVDHASGGNGYGGYISSIGAGANQGLILGRKYNSTFTEAMRIDSSGNLLIGTTDGTPYASNVKGAAFYNSGAISGSADGLPAMYLNRKTSDGTIADFRKDGTTVGSIGTLGGALSIGNNTNSGILFNGTALQPTSGGTSRTDGVNNIGASAYRFNDVYATNALIQTSDANEKQDIEVLSEAEQRVAVAAKGLLRKFRWKSSVEEKGEDARIHFGIIAQDLQAAFEAEGLDAGRYAMFISSTWTDEETGEERSRLGVRYSELLAFIIAAI